MIHYFFYIALFGLIVVMILWLRDCRIYLRTAFLGYRKAAIQGIGCTALSIFGAGVVYLYPGYDIFGLACVLIGLYIQGKGERENVFTTQTSWDRFFGKAPIHQHLAKKELDKQKKMQK